MRSKYSGKFVLRISPDLHKKICHQATSMGKSLNQFCTEALEGFEEGIPQPDWLETIKENFKNRLMGIVLFGSRSRHQETEGSDIDLLLFIKETPQRVLYKTFDDIFKGDNRGRFSPHFVQVQNNIHAVGSLIYEAAIDGIILWDPKGLIHRFFVDIRDEITRGNLKRKFVHGHPYWVHGREDEE